MTQKKKQFLEGTIKRHPDGFGFFIPDDREFPDVYIPKQEMKSAMSNDKVEVKSSPDRFQKDKFRGEIVRIVERKTKKVVGRFNLMNDQFGVIFDDSKAWGEALRVPLKSSQNAKPGELVEALITSYPGEGASFEGEITKVLGDASSPMTDIQRVIAMQQIPDAFPEDVLREAKPLKGNPDPQDFAQRKDLRNTALITIDGATAKDFDDAVFVEQNGSGFRCLVAIADVSHYVQPGSAIDREAYQRGTSVYFPNFVVPMLPEVLSNGLCSLNPHVPRLCLVADMNFDFQGVCTNSTFYEAVMESHARVTYGEAQEVIDGQVSEKLAGVKDVILRCSQLATVLMAKRQREGSMELEIPETTLEIDAMGVPVDVIKSERLFAHKLIEELMLAANVAVAKFLSNRKIPAMYRIHEPPFADAIANLEKYIATFGGHEKLAGEGLQKKLSKALKAFEGTPHGSILNILTLRSMNQAKYSADNLGHFGLGFEHYTHFTSPIRRYPDLIVHRLLKSQVVRNSRYKPYELDDLQTAGTHLSACEQRSAKAERQIMSIKKARFVQKYLGQEFDGLITSVVKFGVFVSLREFDIDGLVRLEDLAKEYLEFDEERLALFNRKTGTRFSIGDAIRIQISQTDVEAGQINFVRMSVDDKGVSTVVHREESQKSASANRRGGKRPTERSARSGQTSARSRNKGEREEVSAQKSGKPPRRKNRSEQTEKKRKPGRRDSGRSRPEEKQFRAKDETASTANESSADRSSRPQTKKSTVRRSGGPPPGLQIKSSHRTLQGRTEGQRSQRNEIPKSLRGLEEEDVKTASPKKKKTLYEHLKERIQNHQAKRKKDASDKSDRKNAKERSKNANNRRGVR
mgnify:CR=1 FL=1